MTDTCQVSHPLLSLSFQPSHPSDGERASDSLLLFFLLLAGQIPSFPLHLPSIELTFGKLQENVRAILAGGRELLWVRSENLALIARLFTRCLLSHYNEIPIFKRNPTNSQDRYKVGRGRGSAKSYQVDRPSASASVEGEKRAISSELPAFSID